MWDFNIYTDNYLSARRPDIVVIDKSQKLVQIIDVAVPMDSNASAKEVEKIDKYKDLSLELTSLWKMKCTVIPLVIGSLGCITSMLETYLQKFMILEFCNVELLQQTAVLGSSYIFCTYL